nr:MAG TPA: hypothetical protein [Caudoviricetes sp.]
MSVPGFIGVFDMRLLLSIEILTKTVRGPSQ